MEKSDYEIIIECLEGDKDAFAVLVSRYKKFIFGIVYKHFNSMDEAEDIAQEAFLKIYKSLKLYNPQYRFSTWSAKITVNLCLDILRKKKISSVSLDEVDILARDNNTPESQYIENERIAMVHSAISKLPEKYSTIFSMYHEKGSSYKEIADKLELPISLIKNRLFRARLMLKESLLGMDHSLSI